jgi:hypothetical protein
MSLSESEMIEILEDIARNGRNQAAQIAAIKVLREVRAGEKPVADGFAALDGPAAHGGARLKAV